MIDLLKICRWYPFSVVLLFAFACQSAKKPEPQKILANHAAAELLGAVTEVFQYRFQEDSLDFLPVPAEDALQVFLETKEIRQLWYGAMEIPDISAKDKHGFTIEQFALASDALVLATSGSFRAVNCSGGRLELPEGCTGFLLTGGWELSSNFRRSSTQIFYLEDVADWKNRLQQDSQLIGVIPLNLWRKLRGKEDLLAIPLHLKNREVEASTENLLNHSYPLKIQIVVMQRRARNDASVSLLDFALSPPGQLLITKEGWIPEKLPERKLRFYK